MATDDVKLKHTLVFLTCKRFAMEMQAAERRQRKDRDGWVLTAVRTGVGVCAAHAVISGVFIFVSMGTQWAKVEYKPANDLEKFSCSGDAKSYVMPYFGICNKVTINDKNADDKCSEWKDSSYWKVCSRLCLAMFCGRQNDA